MFRSDLVFDSLVVQRSRTYVKESQRQQGVSEALFPEREPPKVAAYNHKATYGKLLDSIAKAIRMIPLINLSMKAAKNRLSR